LNKLSGLHSVHHTGESMRPSRTKLLLVGALVTVLVEAGVACPRDQAAVETCEFIFESVAFPFSHASTIVETGNGLLAAWYGGSREGAADVQIWSSRKENGKWSAPIVLASGVQGSNGATPTWNPVLFRSRSGLVMLFYKVGTDPKSWRGMVMTSRDEGISWTVPRPLPNGILGPIKNKPIQLEDGTILAPSSTENHGWHVVIESSADDGVTWSSSGPLNGDGTFVIQPALIPYANGEIQMLARHWQLNANEPQRIMQARSLDWGRTWGLLNPTELPNPNSGIDAAALHDGTAVIVFNDSPAGRSPLTVGISRDHGKSWTRAFELENEAGEEFSYPAVIEDSKGMIHTTYTWKRQRIVHAVIDPHRL
jgi:predicted neuraminidase